MARYTEELLDYLKNQITLNVNTGNLWWNNPGRFKNRNLNKPIGSIDKDGYKTFTIAFKGKSCGLRCARVVYAMSNGKWPKNIVDHINGDKTDDRPDNLRDCSYTGNNLNRRAVSNSGWLGVHKCKTRGNYVASATIFNKRVNLGRFESDKEAALIYNYTAREHFPEFARYNQVFEDVSEDMLIDGQ